MQRILRTSPDADVGRRSPTLSSSSMKPPKNHLLITQRAFKSLHSTRTLPPSVPQRGPARQTDAGSQVDLPSSRIPLPSLSVAMRTYSLHSTASMLDDASAGRASNNNHMCDSESLADADCTLVTKCSHSIVGSPITYS